MNDRFLQQQRRRIERRIKYTQAVIDCGRIDAVLKAKAILANQLVALQRLKLGLYFTCIDCGHQIPTERLEAIPAAIRCLSCQEESES